MEKAKPKIKANEDFLQSSRFPIEMYIRPITTDITMILFPQNYAI